MSDYLSEGATLLLAVYIPDADRTLLDPDQVADELVEIINEERRRNGGGAEDIEISLFPACQWLDADTVANLRAAAQGAETTNNASPSEADRG